MFNVRPAGRSTGCEASMGKCRCASRSNSVGTMRLATLGAVNDDDKEEQNVENDDGQKEETNGKVRLAARFRHICHRVKSSFHTRPFHIDFNYIRRHHELQRLRSVHSVSSWFINVTLSPRIFRDIAFSGNTPIRDYP